MKKEKKEKRSLKRFIPSFDSLTALCVGLIFITTMGAVIFGSCISCGHTQQNPSVILPTKELEHTCTKPPTNLYGAELKNCDENDGVLGCKYFMVWNDPTSLKLFICMYILIRTTCNDAFIMLLGQCDETDKPGAKDVNFEI